MTIAAGSTILASDVQAIKDDVDAIVSASRAIVSTSETTSSTSFTDLSTTGPEVTITTGTLALVGLYTRMSNNSAGQVSLMSVAVSGASTVSAADARSVMATSSAADEGYRIGATFLLVSLTAGSNTFTAKYRVTAGTGTFADRQMFVIPLGD